MCCHSMARPCCTRFECLGSTCVVLQWYACMWLSTSFCLCDPTGALGCGRTGTAFMLGAAWCPGRRVTALQCGYAHSTHTGTQRQEGVVSFYCSDGFAYVVAYTRVAPQAWPVQSLWYSCPLSRDSVECSLAGWRDASVAGTGHTVCVQARE